MDSRDSLGTGPEQSPRGTGRSAWGTVLLLSFITNALLCYALFAPPKYRSEAMVAVPDAQSEGATRAADDSAPQTVAHQSTWGAGSIQASIDLLRSRELMCRIVDRVGPGAILSGAEGTVGETGSRDDVPAVIESALTRLEGLAAEGRRRLQPGADRAGPSDRDRAIETVEQNLSIERLRTSSVVSLSYVSRSPRLSQEVVAAAVEVFLAERGMAAPHDNLLPIGPRPAKRGETRLVRAEAGGRLDGTSETGPAPTGARRRIVAARIERVEEELRRLEAMRESSVAVVQALYGAVGREPYAYNTADPGAFVTAQPGPDQGDAVAAQGAGAAIPQGAGLAEEAVPSETRQALINEALVLVSLQAEEERFWSELAELRRQLRNLGGNGAQPEDGSAELATTELATTELATTELPTTGVPITEVADFGPVASAEASPADRRPVAAGLWTSAIIQSPTYDVAPVRSRLLVGFAVGMLVVTLIASGLSVSRRPRLRPGRKPRDPGKVEQLSWTPLSDDGLPQAAALGLPPEV